MNNFAAFGFYFLELFNAVCWNFQLFALLLHGASQSFAVLLHPL